MLQKYRFVPIIASIRCRKYFHILMVASPLAAKKQGDWPFIIEKIVTLHDCKKNQTTNTNNNEQRDFSAP